MARDHRPRESFTEYGIVLKNSSVGESDAILTLLLEKRGKLPVYARGIKRSKRRFMGGLDLFDTGHFTLEERGSEDHLPLLTGVSQRSSLNAASLPEFTAASVALEITGHLALERDPEGGLYVSPLTECLRRLQGGEALAHLVQYLFLLLARTGFTDFENISRNHPEVLDWITRSSPAPGNALLAPLLQDILRSVEVILGRTLTTRETAERFLLPGLASAENRRRLA